MSLGLCLFGFFGVGGGLSGVLFSLLAAVIVVAVWRKFGVVGN